MIMWLLIVLLIVWFCYDFFLQKQNTLARNFPIIGRLVPLLDTSGIFLRKYWFSTDKDVKPFSRDTVAWISRASERRQNTIGFGTTENKSAPGKVLFIPSLFPTDNFQYPSDKFSGKWIGKDACQFGYFAKSIFNISAISFGSFSNEAIIALSEGAALANIWLNSGEGGLSSYHLQGGCDIVLQIGPEKFGFRDIDGNFDENKFINTAALPAVKMIEIKLAQGGKPGYTGILYPDKICPEVAEAFGIKVGEQIFSSNAHPEIRNMQELIHFTRHLREITQKPVGIKVVMGNLTFWDDYLQLLVSLQQRGIDGSPDFITVDGSEGGTGSSPKSLADSSGLPLVFALPLLIDKLNIYGLKERIIVIAAEKLVTPDRIAWALCCGADFVTSARGFMLSLGCIQALKCHTGHCPTGITTNLKRYTRGFDVSSKKYRILNYVQSIEHDLNILVRSCGLSNPTQFRREHCLIVQNATKLTTLSANKITIST